MKLYIFTAALLINSFLMHSQVGIGNTDPSATLHITGKPAEVNQADGLILPQISLSELTNKTAYGPNQVGALIYVTDASGPTNAMTSNINETGFYSFNGSTWKKIINNAIGDIKTGLQTTDHNGWVLLNGRNTSTLSANQQLRATALGFTSVLPNANNSVLMQNGNTLGGVSGSNTITIAQENLPDVTFLGSAIANGSHSHSYYTTNNNGGSDQQGYPSNNHHRAFRTTDRGPRTERGEILNDGSHVHLVVVSSGGSNTPIQHLPQSISVNMFLYLGD